MYIALWSQIEVNLGIVCACVTILRPLYKTFFSRSRLPAQIPEPETRARKDVELKGLSKLDQLKSQRTYSSVEMISQDRNDMDSQVSLARNSTVSSYNHEFESAGLWGKQDKIELRAWRNGLTSPFVHGFVLGLEVLFNSSAWTQLSATNPYRALIKVSAGSCLIAEDCRSILQPEEMWSSSDSQPSCVTWPRTPPTQPWNPP